jgi:hypothetical protein
VQILEKTTEHFKLGIDFKLISHLNKDIFLSQEIIGKFYTIYDQLIDNVIWVVDFPLDLLAVSLPYTGRINRLIANNLLQFVSTPST